MVEKLRLQLGHVRTLRIATHNGGVGLTSFLLTLSPHLPALETLLVACDCENVERQSFSEALEVSLLPSFEPDSPPPFPTLQTLHIQVYWDIRDHEPLVRMLAERARLGHPIAKVIGGHYTSPWPNGWAKKYIRMAILRRISNLVGEPEH